MLIAGLEFLPFDGVCKCALEQHLPQNVLVYRLEDGALFAVPAEIGKEPHPLIYFFEAAIYKEGVWIVGIDYIKNRYFTPILQSSETNA